MTTSILLSAIVGGSVSFLVVVFANFFRETRSRKRSIAESRQVWD